MKSTFIITACVTALVAVSTPVAAQAPRAERPYRGLFGGGMGEVDQSLIWNASTAAGYDDNVLAQDNLGGDPTTAQAGNFGSFATGLSYSYRKSRVNADLSASMNGQYRPDSSDQFYAGYGGSGGISVGLWRGGGFKGSVSAAYQPYLVLSLEPELAVESLTDPLLQNPSYAGVVGEDYLSYSTDVSLSQQVSRRGSIGLSYRKQVSEFSSGRTSFTSGGLGGGYTHSIGKGLDLRIGYSYEDSSSATEGDGTTDDPDDGGAAHVIDAGVNFNRALSFSRRTTLSFSTGSAGVSDGTTTSYHLTGAAQLRRELGRTWSIAAGYSRSVQFVDLLQESILSDGAGIDLGGLINRRLQFNSHAGISFGQSGVSGEDEFDTYLATAGLNYALARYVSLDLNYFFYHYSFAEGAVLPAGFAPQMDRQGISVSVSLWAPIFTRTRRPDAAR